MIELAVALVVSIGPTIAAVAAYRKAKSVDEAVNNRPKGEPRILDLVLEIFESTNDTNQRVTQINGHLQEHLRWHDLHDLQDKAQVLRAIEDHDG